MEINHLGLFPVLSNLALLIASYVAVRQRLLLRASFSFIEVFVSSFYHVAMYAGWSLGGSADKLHGLDFFFAQMHLVLAGLYFIYFGKTTYWIEWLLIIFFGFAVAVLQLFTEGELVVQIAVGGVVLGIVGIYWIVYLCTTGNGRLPPYRWDYLLLGLVFLSSAVVLYTAPGVWPRGYDWMHGLWHCAGGIGLAFIWLIKDAAPKYANAAAKIGNKV